VAADSGSLTVTEQNGFTVQGGTLISTTRDGSNIRIDSSALADVESDTSPRLGGDLNANGYNLGSVGSIDATVVNAVFNGPLTGLVHGIDIRELNEYREFENSWDFGGFTPVAVTNLWDFLFATVSVDFGSIGGNTVPVSLDLGSI